MSTIPSNLAFTALQLKVAAANADQKSRIAPVQVFTTSETKSENALQLKSKLFEGLNQQAVLHFQVGQALRAKAATAPLKEPPVQAKALAAPLLQKKEDKPVVQANQAKRGDVPSSGLFADLDLVSALQSNEDRHNEENDTAA